MTVLPVKLTVDPWRCYCPDCGWASYRSRASLDFDRSIRGLPLAKKPCPRCGGENVYGMSPRVVRWRSAA